MKFKKLRRSAIFYGILGLLCFVNIADLYIFALMLFAASAGYAYTAYKHKDDNDTSISEKLGLRKTEKLSKQEIKENKITFQERYKKRLEEIEKDFPDDIYEDEIEEDE